MQLLFIIYRLPRASLTISHLHHPPTLNPLAIALLFHHHLHQQTLQLYLLHLIRRKTSHLYLYHLHHLFLHHHLHHPSLLRPLCCLLILGLFSPPTHQNPTNH